MGSDHILLTEIADGKRDYPLVPDLASNRVSLMETKSFALSHRRSKKINGNQEMMIALAFASTFQLKQHSLFPQVSCLYIVVAARCPLLILPLLYQKFQYLCTQRTMLRQIG